MSWANAVDLQAGHVPELAIGTPKVEEHAALRWATSRQALIRSGSVSEAEPSVISSSERR